MLRELKLTSKSILRKMMAAKMIQKMKKSLLAKTTKRRKSKKFKRQQFHKTLKLMTTSLKAGASNSRTAIH